jgi:hypothetical protein
MSHILLLTNSTGSSVDILPALELLNHRVHILPAEPTALLETDPCDVVLLDARKDLVGARSLTQLLKAGTTGHHSADHGPFGCTPPL